MLIALFVSAAQAGETYSVDFPIVGGVPTVAADGFWGLEHAYDVAPGYPDRSVASTWSYVSCALESGVVKVRFSATAANWPTSWPSNVSCSSDGYTLSIHLVDAVQPWTIHDRTVVPSLGITVDLSPVGGKPRGTYRVYDLPVGPTYAEGVWPARLSPLVEWDGVQCSMAYAPNGNPALQVVALPDAAAADGYCILESASGLPHAIALEIIR